MIRAVVLYARVSSKDQEREGFSIPAQLDLLRSYAAGRKLPIAEEFIDVETAKQAGRAAFGQMVAFARKHCGRLIVLVEKTDRLYRNLRDWVTIDELDVEIHPVWVSQRPVLQSLRAGPFWHHWPICASKCRCCVNQKAERISKWEEFASANVRKFEVTLRRGPDGPS